MTAFTNKYIVPVAVMALGTVVVATGGWMINIHKSYATSEQVAKAVGRISDQQASSRRRDLLKQNARDLENTRDKKFQLRNYDINNDLEAAQYLKLEQREKDLEAETECIRESGEECDR